MLPGEWGCLPSRPVAVGLHLAVAKLFPLCPKDFPCQGSLSRFFIPVRCPVIRSISCTKYVTGSPIRWPHRLASRSVPWRQRCSTRPGGRHFTERSSCLPRAAVGSSVTQKAFPPRVFPPRDKKTRPGPPCFCSDWVLSSTSSVQSAIRGCCSLGRYPKRRLHHAALLG